VLAPTRELAMQISQDALLLSKYLNLNILTVFGGMDYNKQRNYLVNKTVDILIGTPGRIIDFINKHELHLNKVDTLILDEADRMLDMGFIPDVKKIIRACPPKENRQTLFFSATINTDVRNLAGSWTRDSFSVEIEPDELIVKSIEQIVYIVSSREKYYLLYNILMKEKPGKILVFVNRRDEARDLGKKLFRNGIECEIISGEVDQRKRIKVLDNFKSSAVKVLIATDVAGRGIHVDNISHVINFSLPGDPQDYVHRIGRTGRAGATGISISFATEDDSFSIPAIEDLIGKPFVCINPPEELLKQPPPYEREAKKVDPVKSNYPRPQRNFNRRK
jgi:ATP-dependent RNA helicase RhlB